MVGSAALILFLGMAVHPVASSSASDTNTCVGEDCMILSISEQDVYEMKTSLLQTSTHVESSDSEAKSKRNLLHSKQQLLGPDRSWILDLTATFVSNTGLLCVEGPIKQTIGALALKQAGLHGAMYNESRVRSETNCTSQGYSLGAGEDPTYVGVNVFFRSAADQTAFAQAEGDALEAYRAQYSLPQDMDLVLMSKCTAHLESEVGLSVQGQCGPVNELSGTWTHHDLVNRDEENCCDSGPFQFSVFSLATIKSTRQFPQHPYDQIKIGTCNDWGFMSPLEEDRIPDHCFSHFEGPEWALSCFSDPAQGFDDVQRIEGILFAEGPSFGIECDKLGLDEYVTEIMSVQGCHCLPGTEVMQGAEADGRCTTAEELPAIREWWHGQA